MSLYDLHTLTQSADHALNEYKLNNFRICDNCIPYNKSLLKKFINISISLRENNSLSEVDQDKVLQLITSISARFTNIIALYNLINKERK